MSHLIKSWFTYTFILWVNEDEKVHLLVKLQDKLSEYLQELPVLGFNSGKYDINACNVSFKHEQVKFVIKRNNNNMCLKT
jgi:hypothetical protein